MLDTFKFECDGWSDAGYNEKLRYSFYQVTASGRVQVGVSLSLSLLSLSRFFTSIFFLSQLSVGLPVEFFELALEKPSDDATSATFLAVVEDTRGSRGYSTITVNLVALVIEESALDALVLGKIAAAEGDNPGPFNVLLMSTLSIVGGASASAQTAVQVMCWWWWWWW